MTDKQRTVITVHKITASEVTDYDNVMLPGEKNWVEVYEVLTQDRYPQDDAVLGRIFDTELDDRYVMLRVTADPTISVGEREDKRGMGDDENQGKLLRTWQTHGDLIGGQPAYWGAPFERDDRYVVLRRYDLVDVQIATTITTI